MGQRGIRRKMQARVKSYVDCSSAKTAVSPVRYPGGKQRFLSEILTFLPAASELLGRFVEPFVGGGSVFFAVSPKRALLSDKNAELITLYRGIRRDPDTVWASYCRLPRTKKGYYKVRDRAVRDLSLVRKAARTLYLNRTCFKGMWRHNAEGKFNVGYGGQSRRWVITNEVLRQTSKQLGGVELRCSDFEPVIDGAEAGDVVFCDPPYRPGHCEMFKQHYVQQQFSYADHTRLAAALARASKRRVKWVLTTSLHPKIVSLFEGAFVFPLNRGAGKSPGRITKESGEAVITNFMETKYG